MRLKERLNYLKLKALLNKFSGLDWLKKNQSCLLCEDSAQHTRGWIFCALCLADLPWFHLHEACIQCGLPLQLPDSAQQCGACLNAPPFFDKTISVFHYQRPIRQMLSQYKYQGKLDYVPTFADMLAFKIRASYQKSRGALPDLILSVPLSEARLKQRGFNQSLELAKVVSRVLGVPYHVSVVKRLRDTPMQAGLTLKKRRANIEGAFALMGPHFIARYVKNKRLAIIDDVMTTGFTLAALAKLLKEAGAKSVDNWVLARTPAH